MALPHDDAPVRPEGDARRDPRPAQGGDAPGAEAVPEPNLDRILTVPNAITLVRLSLLPVFLWLLFAQDNRVAAACLLAGLGATDWCDGYIARHFNQVSNLGKVLDPTADRLLFFVGIGGIIVARGAPLWFCVIVLVREVTVAAITVTITAMGAKPVDVTWFGKAGTFGLMFAFPLFLGGSSDAAIAPVCTALAWVAGIPGLLLSYYAAFRYVPLWRVNLAEARRVRAAGQDVADAG